MTTLAIVISSVLLCVLIGLPMGVLAGKSDRFEAFIRPVLDTMQTIPAFVYLVPVVMMIGIGNVSGVIVTIIFALPPLVRLTSLGIRGVSPTVVEAARAFGASPAQILRKVELPLATPTILAGLNQTIMLSLSMVVIASMISVKGLGNEVLRAMGRLDAGKAIVGGLGIVMLAIVLDRITQGLGRSGRDRLVARLFGKTN
jgi:glycine betaine/proline transport system permease protein